MSKITPKVFNGSKQLVMSVSSLCDDREDVIILIPTVYNRDQKITFKFNHEDTNNPTASIISDSVEASVLEVKLGKVSLNAVGVRNAIDIKIAGQDYKLIFSITRVIEHSVRVDVSLYE